MTEHTKTDGLPALEPATVPQVLERSRPRSERIEPSKNVVRGFQAYGEMLELFPELRGQV